MPYAEPTSPVSSASSSRQASPNARTASLPSFASASEAIDGLPITSSRGPVVSAAAGPSRSKTPTPPRSRSHSQAHGGYVDYKFQDEAPQVAPVLPRRSSHISPPGSNRHSRHASPAMSPTVTVEHVNYGTSSAGIMRLPRRSSSYGRHALPLAASSTAPRAFKDSNASSASSTSDATLVNLPDTSSGPMDKVSDSLEKYAARIREQEEREKAEQDLKRKLKQQKVQRQLEARAREREQIGDIMPHAESNSALTGTSSSEGEAEDDSKPHVSTALKPAQESHIPFPSTRDLAVSPNATPTGSSSATPTATSPTGPVPLTCPEASATTRRAPVINPRHRFRDVPSLGLRRQPSSSLQLNIPPTPPIIPSAGTPNSLISPAGSNASSTSYLYDLDRPSSSFIRKKSGEVVKPSLKRRSISTPHLPIREESGYTKSEPPTPGINGDYSYQRHKNVRFAGSGNDQEKLENVVLFLSQQKVTAVSKTADGEDGAYPVTETETEADTDASEYIAFRTRRAQEAREIDAAERISFADSTSTVPRIRIDFSPNGREALKGHNVVLERVELPSNPTEPLVLRGSVIVRNLMFQKWVTIRFTMDNWQTVSEVAATHVIHLPPQTTGDEGWDRFTFAIKLEDLRRKIDEKQLLLCIRFSIEGKEWWDSNDGQNYRFVFKKTQPPKRRRVFDLSAPESPTSPRSPIAAAPLPGTRGSNFGRMTGWNFPGMGNPAASPSKGVLGQPNANSPPQRRTALPRRSSDLSRHPPSFTAPPPPDVHEHLKLKAYCAPAPPLSPPREALPALAEHKEAVRKPVSAMVIGGQYASIPVPDEPEPKTHERRRSWGGEDVEEEIKLEDENSWTKHPESQSKALSPPINPVIQGEDAIIPSIGERLASSQGIEMQSFRKEDSMSDLTCSVNELSIITPPSSALSSPPAHDPESGSASGSTSTMSPASMTASPEMLDVDLPDVVVDPAERDRQMEAAAAGSAGINSDSYQDFIKKYCFFSSYSSETVSPAHSRSQTPLGFTANASSPNPYGADYPTFAPRDQLTPTGSNPLGQASSSDHYFGFQPGSSIAYPGTRTYNPLGWGLSPSGSGHSSNNSNSGGTTTPYV